MDARMRWLQTPEARRLAPAAEDKAWASFLAKYPNSDKGKFLAQMDYDDNHKATAEIYFKKGPCCLKSVSGTKSKFWPLEMRSAP